MTRFKSLFAALVGTAIMAVAPVANAQSMHIVGAGSSAQFLGTMIGISTMVSNNLSAGQCQFHWTKKNAINAHDDRDSLNRILDETNNVGIVWEANCSDPTGATGLSDVWLDAQYDSTLGVRLFSAQQTGATAGSGATVYLTAADIAGTASDNLVNPANLWADNKADVAIPQGIITFIGNASPGTFHVNMGLTDIRPEDALFDTIRAYSALNTTNYDGLGYVGPTKYIGAPIYTAQSGSTSNLTPVGFALSGGTDPISKVAVPAYTTYPIGAAPIIFVYNNAGVFNSGLADLTTGVNELGTKTGGPFGLAHLFDGTTSCDTNNAAFTNGGDGLATPLTVILREPLSGTENTTEWTLFRTEDNSTDSQEKGVINPTRTPYNPLDLACNTAGTGTRQRRVGNGQVITAVNSIPHAIGYMFYSFANAASVIGTTAVNQANYQYFTLDGVDPLSLPNGKFGANTALQQLPFCSAVLCPSSSWTDGISYPNLRNGTYKSWSVYRWLIAKTDSDPLGPTVLVSSIRDYIDSTVADFVPFEACPVGDTNPICTGNNNFDGLEVYRSHFTQEGKDCSYTGTTQAGEQECNGAQTPTEALTGGDSLGGSTEQGGDQGGLIIGWDHDTVKTANQTTGTCAGKTKVTKTAGRNFGFSATSALHTGGDPAVLEGLTVQINGTGYVVSSCATPSASILYVNASLGTQTNLPFAAYIAPTACGANGCANGVIGKKQ